MTQVVIYSAKMTGDAALHHAEIVRSAHVKIGQVDLL